MYDLPLDFNERTLIGRYLDSVNIGAFTTSILLSRPQNFPGKADTIIISIHGAVNFCVEGEQFVGEGESPGSLTGLVLLLTKEVTDVRRVGKSSLQISFEGDAHITFMAEESVSFESYSINVPDVGIFVV